MSDDLAEAVAKMRTAAAALAAEPRTPEVVNRARALEAELVELWPRLAGLKTPDARSIALAYADARLDVSKVIDASTSDDSFGTALRRVSDEAFALAQGAIPAADDVKARARALNVELDDLWRSVEEQPAAERPDLERMWSEARLDVGYVLSDGELSPSIRLARHLSDRR